MRFGRQAMTALMASAIVFGTAATGITSLAPTAAAQDATTAEVSAQAITAGQTVSVNVDQLNVRATPTVSGTIATTLPFGTQVVAATGPVTADGYSWFRLQQNGAFIGWSVASFLVPVTSTPTPPVTGGFAFGETVVVNTDLLNVRSSPSLSGSVLAVYASGRTATISGGPTTADGNTWYAVDNLGWVASQFLVRSGGSTTPPPTGSGFPVGTVVVVNVDLLNVRAGAGTGNAVTRTAVFGTEFIVVEGPVAANGFNWYRVQGGGWVAGELVARKSGGTTPPPTGSTFPVGATVTVNAAQVNIRSGAGTAFPVSYTANLGDTFTVYEGPVVANGYNWYRVSGLVGAWIAGNFLTLTTDGGSGTGQFAYGETVSVTAGLLNVRATPSTAAAIVATYAFGRSATITGGPTVAGGVTWYAVDNLGWVSSQYLT